MNKHERYVANLRRRGLSDKDIARTLSVSGWSPHQINHVLKKADEMPADYIETAAPDTPSHTPPDKQVPRPNTDDSSKKGILIGVVSLIVVAVFAMGIIFINQDTASSRQSLLNRPPDNSSKFSDRYFEMLLPRSWKRAESPELTFVFNSEEVDLINTNEAATLTIKILEDETRTSKDLLNSENSNNPIEDPGREESYVIEGSSTQEIEGIVRATNPARQRINLTVVTADAGYLITAESDADFWERHKADIRLMLDSFLPRDAVEQN